MMLTHILPLTAGLLVTYLKPIYAQDSSRNDSAACAALLESAPQALANLTVNVAQLMPAGTTYNDSAMGGANPNVAYDLAEHCRFSANITTSNQSSVRFEIFMPPASAWNGDFVATGNGGVQGYIAYDTMAPLLGKYNFSVASTNTGHDGGVGDGSFLLNDPESQIDFGYRAVHLTTVYSKTIINLFYGQNASLSYWSGCSSGGKQGLKGIQMYPSDWDAAIVGAPAYDWNWLNTFTYYVNAIVNPPNSTGYIPPSSWASIALEVRAQCDGADGVVDGAILEPGKCFLNYDAFRCGGNSTFLNETTCLSDEQLQTYKTIYTNLTDPDTQELLFPAFNVGSEFLWAASVNGVPFGPAPSYFLYQVLNVTELVYPISTPPVIIDGQPMNFTTLLKLAKEGNMTNPGMIRATDPDLRPFFDRGGKVIHYVGDADWLIPTNSSFVYHQNVLNTVGNVTDSYQFYVVSGMGHCSAGPGAAFNFGAANQQQTVSKGTGQSLVFDAQHDATLALMAWRQNGTRPETLIGAKYIGDDIRNGTQFTRKICPYPLVGRYVGGNTTDQASYECQM